MDALRGVSADAAKDPALLAVFALSSAMLATPMSAQMVLMSRGLGLASRPEVTSAYFAAEFAPSFAKPLYALLTDALPIAGRRRAPYIVIASAACAVLLVLLSRVETVVALFAVGVANSLSSSMLETAADGQLVQLAAGDPKVANRLQAVGMGARTLGSVVGTGLGVALMRTVPARDVIAGCAAFPALCTVAGIFIREDARRATAAAGEEPRQAAPVLRGCRELVAAYWHAVGWRALLAALFLLAYTVVPTAQDAFSTFTYSEFDGVLPDWVLSLSIFFSMVGGLLATLVYWGWVSAGVCLRRLFVLGALCGAALGLTRILVVDEGLRHASGFGPGVLLSLVSTIVAFGARLAYMPLLGLAAQYAPEGKEALGYSLLVSSCDIGSAIAAATTAKLTQALRLGRPPGRSWARLPAFIGMCAVLKVATLLLMPALLQRGGDEGGSDVADKGPDPESPGAPEHHTRVPLLAPYAC